MNLSAPFIRRPIATSLLAAAVLLAGLLAFTLLPVAPLPRVDFPTIQVQANLPGASPETMASAVATPLERRFGRIAGVTEITSTSTLGSTAVVLQFDLDRDVDSAARDVQAAIVAAGGELPANLPFRPTYRKVNPADAPSMILSVTSETIPLPQVYEAANAILAQKIARVEGVGQVFVGGGQQPAVRVRVDPVALAGVGLGMEDVRTALMRATVNQPTGSLPGETVNRTIATNDQLFGAAAFRPLLVAYRGGAAVRLTDVAEVFDGVENDRAAAWVNGRRAVLLIIRRRPGANIIQTNEQIRALLPELARSISPAIKVEVAMDRTHSIRASVRDVELTLVISVLLVVLVVLAFLRSFRATILPSVAVPLSLVGTFGAMYLLGYSLDNLSLMALTISTGFVVDDAIVVTENVSRHVEAGMPAREAALRGAREIAFTIVSITVSLLAVFIPILFMGGIVGRLFREFAVTLSIAIAVSAVVSLTVTPTLAAVLLGRRAKPRRAGFQSASERVFSGILNLYRQGLDWVLVHPRRIQLLVLVTVGITIAQFIAMPKGLFPQQDTGFLMGFSEAPQDVSFRSMRSRQEEVNRLVREDPDIATVTSFIGGGQGTSNTGTVFIDLKPVPPRRQTADQIVGRLRKKLGSLVGINLFLQAAQDLRMGGRSSRTQYQYTLQDPNLEELRAWAPRMLERLRKVPALTDLATDQQTSGMELALAIDRDTSSRLGITPQMIDDTLYDAYGQRQVATMFAALNQYRVVLEVKADYQKTPNDLAALRISSPSGEQYPITSLATQKLVPAPLAVTHQSQLPSVTLSFNLAPGVALSDAMEAVRKAERDIALPAGIRATYQGTAQAFKDSSSSQGLLILAALCTVYIVLGVLYESFVHPITILSTLPSASIGALLALRAMQMDLSIIALIGLLLLVGIVKKNAIMMIDFALAAEREQGLSPKEAIREAAVLRFRPILMTTLAAIFGSLPLALGGGIGAELRQPLGVAVVGGLIASQLLTLYTTPAMYLLFARLTSNQAGSRLMMSPPSSRQPLFRPATKERPA